PARVSCQPSVSCADRAARGDGNAGGRSGPLERPGQATRLHPGGAALGPGAAGDVSLHRAGACPGPRHDPRLRRRFSVDSDRVFPYGWREGGTMAYDVGLAHPDQFAGVLPQNASTKYFPERYASNAQYLPFYIVEGDMNGGGPLENRKLLAEWIRCGYPCI